MPSRSAPTATTRAPYAGSAVASSSACRLLPEPETRTTRRAGAGSVTRAPYRRHARRPTTGHFDDTRKHLVVGYAAGPQESRQITAAAAFTWRKSPSPHHSGGARHHRPDHLDRLRTLEPLVVRQHLTAPADWERRCPGPGRRRGVQGRRAGRNRRAAAAPMDTETATRIVATRPTCQGSGPITAIRASPSEPPDTAADTPSTNPALGP